MAFVNNFSTSFRYLDFIFGTDKKYREYRDKVKAARTAMANATEEEQAAIERKFLEETEAAGTLAEREAEARGASWLGAKPLKKTE